MVVDIRYHVSSLVAVFLALGLGLLIGMALNSDGEILRQQEARLTAIQTSLVDLRSQHAALSAELIEAQHQVETYETAWELVVPRVLAGQLAGHRVAVVVVGRQEPPERLVRRVAETLHLAGAGVTGLFTWVPPPPGQARQVAASSAAVAAALVGRASLPAQRGELGIQPVVVRVAEAVPGGLADVLVCVLNYQSSEPGLREWIRGLLAATRGWGVQGVLVTSAQVGADPLRPLAGGHLAVSGIDQPLGQLALVYGLAQGQTGLFGVWSRGRPVLPPMPALPASASAARQGALPASTP